MNQHKLQRLFPHASVAFQKLNGGVDMAGDPKTPVQAAVEQEQASQKTHEDHRIPSPVQDTEPQHAILSSVAGDPAAEGAGTGRIVVSITSIRQRLLDEDNHVVKFLVDGLRYAGLIPSDAPDKVHIHYTQVKCRKGEDHTQVKITYP